MCSHIQNNNPHESQFSKIRQLAGCGLEPIPPLQKAWAQKSGKHGE